MLLCALRRRSKQLNNLNRNESWSQKQHKNVDNGESLKEGSKQPLSKFVLLNLFWVFLGVLGAEDQRDDSVCNVFG